MNLECRCKGYFFYLGESVLESFELFEIPESLDIDSEDSMLDKSAEGFKSPDSTPESLDSILESDTLESISDIADLITDA